MKLSIEQIESIVETNFLTAVDQCDAPGYDDGDGWTSYDSYRDNVADTVKEMGGDDEDFRAALHSYADRMSEYETKTGKKVN